MPVRPEILYHPGLTTEDDEPLTEAIEKAQHEARQEGLPKLEGVAWPWCCGTLSLGNHILTILDDDAREQCQARERRTALKELARGAVIH